MYYQTHAENRSQLRLPAGVSHNVSDEQRKRYLPLLNTAGRDTGCGLKQTKKERKVAMPNKVLRLLFLSVPLPVTLAGTCITAGTPSMCYAATTDTEKGVINITQSVSAVRSESEEQNYTFSYSAYDPATYDGKVGFSIRFDKGFYPRSLNLGDWTDYKGELSIEVYHEKNFLGKETVSPGNEVDMTKYEGCDMIRILYGEEETNSVKNFTGMILSGEIHASESDEKLLVSADCFGTDSQ